MLLQETAGSTLEVGWAWNTGMLGQWRDGREPEMGCKGGSMSLVLRKEQFDRGDLGVMRQPPLRTGLQPGALAQGWVIREQRQSWRHSACPSVRGSGADLGFLI